MHSSLSNWAEASRNGWNFMASQSGENQAEQRNAPVVKGLDRARATAFIKALYLFVLDRKEPGKPESEYWVDFLVKGQDPTDVLTRFGESHEYQARLMRFREANKGFPPGHFYSPIVNTTEIELDAPKLFKRHPALGLEMNLAEQKNTFQLLAQHMNSMPFGDEPTPGLRYNYNNTSYAFGDAFAYWGMIATYRPRRIIEVGSGFTSALALDAIQHFRLETACTFIDPHPDLLLKVAKPTEPHKVIANRVQEVNPTIVEALEPGDILFIDSSHVVKTGSDVHYEITELLPRVAPGVLLHFHDIFDSFEYPAAWVIEAGQSWNELYFLQAFLMYNSEFKIQYFNDYFVKECEPELRLLPNEVRRKICLNPGGGLWLRRV
jgi:hypothetical protein